MTTPGFAEKCTTLTENLNIQIKNLHKSKNPMHELMEKKGEVLELFTSEDFKEIFNQIPEMQGKAPKNLSAQNYLEIAEYLPPYQKNLLQNMADKLVVLQEKSLNRLEELISEWKEPMTSATEGPVNALDDGSVFNELKALEELREGLKPRITQKANLDKTTGKIDKLITSVGSVNAVLQIESYDSKSIEQTDQFVVELQRTLENRNNSDG